MAPPRKNVPVTTPLGHWLDAIVPAVYTTDGALAQAVGVHRSYISKWRRGMTPQPPALVKLAAATRTDVSVLTQIAAYRPEPEK